jgi:hypothetical protein
MTQYEYLVRNLKKVAGTMIEKELRQARRREFVSALAPLAGPYRR